MGSAHVSPAKVRVPLSLAKENSSTSVVSAASPPGRRAAAPRERRRQARAPVAVWSRSCGDAFDTFASSAKRSYEDVYQ